MGCPETVSLSTGKRPRASLSWICKRPLLVAGSGEDEGERLERERERAGEGAGLSDLLSDELDELVELELVSVSIDETPIRLAKPSALLARMANRPAISIVTDQQKW
jgi:hypothetical protein